MPASDRPTELGAGGGHSITTGFLANVIGMSALAAVQIIFTPVYLHLTGASGYGLIAFAVMLQGLAPLLDLGMSVTVSREVARYAASIMETETTQRLIHSVEVLYAALAVVAFTAFILAADVIARRWLGQSALPAVAVHHALLWIAALLALQFPLIFYQAALRGLGRQVALNVYRVAAATLANVVATALMITVTRSVVVFFGCHAVATLIHVMALRARVRAAMPRGAKWAFDPELLRRAGRFSAGMLTITVVAVVVSQADKVVVSASVPLEQFGYYALGAVVAGALSIIIVPAFSTLMPRFAAMCSRGQRDYLPEFYARALEAVAAVLAPAAAVIAVFAYELIRVWTGSFVAAREAAPIATLLAIGTALNGIMNVPYALQLGEGRIRLAVLLSAGQVLFYVPVLWILVGQSGATGAAAAWLAVNTAYLFVGLWATHRNLFTPNESLRVTGRAAIPVALSALCVLVARALFPAHTSTVLTLSTITAVYLITASIAACSSPGVRSAATARLHR